MRSKILCALIALGLLTMLVPAGAGNPPNPAYSPENTRIFWFVHLSDTHIGASGDSDSSNLQWIVSTGRSVIAPSFMVVTGDLTDSTNGNIFGFPNGPYQSEWDQYKNILAAAGVDATWYYDLPGNHDAYNDRTFAYYRANSIQGRMTGGMQVTWTRTFDWGKYHFLGINTADNTGAGFSLVSPYGDHAGLDTTELAFITSDLNNTANADADLTMVFGHHPVTSTGDSQDTYLYYGHQEFVAALDTHAGSLFGYGHTHAQSDVQFTGNTYTGVMTGGGVRYLNIASLGKSSSNNYDIIAVDCNGVSSVPATVGTWPVVLITAPVSRMLGTTVNPYSYTVPAAASNPIRALVFDPGAISSVAFRVDAESNWHPMTVVAGNPKLYEGVWNASTLSTGDHTITVQATGSSTKSHTVTVRVTGGNTAPVAANDAYTVNAGETLSVAAPGVLGNDSDANGDPLTASVIAAPANGTLGLNANGSFIYTPATGFSGTDSFAYSANDGQASSTPATVTITVKATTTDMVTIKGATWTRRTSTLAVQATSTAQPTAVLTINYGTGTATMTYISKARAYTFSKKVTPAPANVTVTSSLGGSATKTVTQK